MKSQNGSGHLLLVMAIVVIIIGLLGFLFWKNVLAAEGEKYNNERSFFPSKRADPISWSEYNGEDLPVTFKYPSAWKIIETPRGSGNAAYVKGVAKPGDKHDLAMLIFFHQRGDEKSQSVCPVNLPKHTISCESYSTRYMRGVMIEYTKPEEGYIYNTYIRNDYYSIVSYKRFMSKDTFKKILKTFVPLYK